MSYVKGSLTYTVAYVANLTLELPSFCDAFIDIIGTE